MGRADYQSVGPAAVKTHVEFRSPAFPPYSGEADESNTGRFGKRLAEFLVQGLEKKGFLAEGIVAEDWGWRISIRNDEFPLWIGCANYDEYPEDGFLCFIEPHQPTFRKLLFFGKIDVTSHVSALRQAIDEVLSAEPTVTGMKWWSFDEFNNPRNG